ncbi:hypothetical protein D3C74_343670 [compost metagenome]|jgi:hypothetical protein
MAIGVSVSAVSTNATAVVVISVGSSQAKMYLAKAHKSTVIWCLLPYRASWVSGRSDNNRTGSSSIVTSAKYLARIKPAELYLRE